VPDEKICLSRVYKSIKKAKIDVFVKNLEKGIDTRIGESGSLLSGGLKQRVALARAFYFDKDVFILDESTSSLDVETELEIQKEILELKGKKTLIIIAHKKDFLNLCDTVYKLNNGKLELMLNGSN
jgi:ABC-type bacteriocin/lantibiotic exporter with double-glycine peptidase domain